jgi:hypothetical protein
VSAGVWFRRTDKDGGVSHTAHRCWDAKRFVRIQHEQALKEGGKAEQITEEDFVKATGKQQRRAA